MFADILIFLGLQLNLEYGQIFTSRKETAVQRSAFNVLYTSGITTYEEAPAGKAILCVTLMTVSGQDAIHSALKAFY